MKMRTIIGEDIPRREAVNILDIKPGQRVLHLGCGLGACLPLLKERGADVVAVDSCRCRVDASRQAVRNGRWHNVRVMQINNAMLPFADGCFDAIISTGGFTRSDNFRLMIHESGRLLRAGGKMAVIEFLPPENAGIFCTGLARLYYLLSHTDPYCAWRQELNNIIVPLEEHRVWHGLGQFVYGCKNKKYIPIPDMIKALNNKANQINAVPPSAKPAAVPSAPAQKASAKAAPAAPAQPAKAATAPANAEPAPKTTALVKAAPVHPVKAAPKAVVIATAAKAEPAPATPAQPAKAAPSPAKAEPAPATPAQPAPAAPAQPAKAAPAPAKAEPVPAKAEPVPAKAESAPAAPAQPDKAATAPAKAEPAPVAAKVAPAHHPQFDTPTTEPTVDAIRRHEVPVLEPAPAATKETKRQTPVAAEKPNHAPAANEQRKKHEEPLSAKTKTAKNNLTFADLVSKYESDLYSQEPKAEEIPLKIDAPSAPHIPQQPKAQSEGLLSHLFGKKTIESSLPRNLLSGNAKEDKDVRNVLRHPTPKAATPAKMTLKDKTGSRSLLRSWTDKKAEPKTEAQPQNKETPPDASETDQKMMMIPAPKRKRKKN
ncbi:MAG: methyltransferase domain-containing protein [bacterium]|nr:methyltransferase domain-containing protein [bacterium]